MVGATLTNSLCKSLHPSASFYSSCLFLGFLGHRFIVKKMCLFEYVYITYHKEMVLLKGVGGWGWRMWAPPNSTFSSLSLCSPWRGSLSSCLGPGGNIKYLSLAIIWLFSTALGTLQQTFLNKFLCFLYHHVNSSEHPLRWEQKQALILSHTLLDHPIHGQKLPQCKMCEPRQVPYLPFCSRKGSWISHFTVLYLCYTIKKMQSQCFEVFAFLLKQMM